MTKSIYEVNQKRRNHGAKHSDFPVGTRVRVVCVCQDFHFFDPDKENLKGEVIRNPGYGLIVIKWDEPRHYEDDYIQYEFNFEPEDLVLIDRLYESLSDKDRLDLVLTRIRDCQKEVPKEFEDTFKKHFWDILA